MPHNLSWNALTPLAGTGGTLLDGARRRLSSRPESSEPGTRSTTG